MINIKNLNIRSKRVLIRVDYNIPIIKSKIINDFRIKSSFKTINYCLSQNCSIVIMSHLGRPKQSDDKYSLEPIVEYLEDNFNTYVHFSDDCKSTPTHIILVTLFLLAFFITSSISFL